VYEIEKILDARLVPLSATEEAELAREEAANAVPMKAEASASEQSEVMKEERTEVKTEMKTEAGAEKENAEAKADAPASTDMSSQPTEASMNSEEKKPDPASEVVQPNGSDVKKEGDSEERRNGDEPKKEGEAEVASTANGEDAAAEEKQPTMREEYLIKWKGYSYLHNTWENPASIAGTKGKSLWSRLLPPH
jgi:chromodomain-helicase-DNA-binding protein 7